MEQMRTYQHRELVYVNGRTFFLFFKMIIMWPFDLQTNL